WHRRPPQWDLHGRCRGTAADGLDPRPTTFPVTQCATHTRFGTVSAVGQCETRPESESQFESHFLTIYTSAAVKGKGIILLLGISSMCKSQTYLSQNLSRSEKQQQPTKSQTDWKEHTVK